MADCVFHQDIMVCILTRLPVKSILRFRSVCKPWRDLFSTPEFIKKHRVQFSSDTRNHSIIIENRAVDYGRTVSLLEIESDEKKSTIIEYPHPEIHLMNIVGCCNGLICMGCPRLGQEDIVLWNPAMKLFKFVSLSGNVDFKDPYSVSLGFGYDAEGNDFKVVVIFGLKGESKRIGVKVYSVNSDSWITIDPGFQFNEYNAESFVTVDGNPYWFATVDENESAKSFPVGDVLVWFDVRKMTFKAVPVLTRIFHVGDMASVLVDWKGCLGALVCKRNDEGVVYSIDVWVFDDSEQFWRKDHTFGPVEVRLGRILDRSKNGKILGRCPSGELIGFDPDTGWVKVYDVQPWSYESYLYLYVESFTNIKGMGPVCVNVGKRKTSMIHGGADSEY